MKDSSLPFSQKAFSIIELMVGIFIFTLGLLYVYMLLISSMNANEHNKNAIIASNLAREQIEILHNIRDTNYKRLQIWNQQKPQDVFSATTKLFSTGSYYTLENAISPNAFENIENITSGFEEGADKLSGASMQSYRLCFDAQKNYRYCKDIIGDKTELPFYRYLFVEELTENGMVIPDAFRITSKVIWDIKGYHEFDIKTILTDWRRI